ncbi:hypothetical protein B1R32_10253 [Abditibacterium utsteinense]|uniref:YXWGXW repeat-containing protein n=1 Tax=Abditibacterium utsteinense TaxID=1960156 RepID=A0A2S8SW74_9BACT|nr:hypothetical protein [Abditibacterium utsteinense]PQV65046.1 hypothetical protein B1R32_10253 [Abditibacterium utsteinense]
MQFLKLPFLLGALGATTLVGSAQAQTSSHTSKTVDAAGNVTRTTTQTPLSNAPSAAAFIAGQGVLGANSTTSSARSYRGRGRGSRDYYYPAPPAYPYPAPAYNNYYYPALPSTTEITPRPYNWTVPSTITNIPLGTYYNGYPAPAYPSYPGYPSYPAAGYGYPAPAYGYPAPAYGYPAYPGVPYPAYGGVYYNGVGNGGIYSQSQDSGYGLSVGNGGISVQLGNRRTTSSTTVTRY